MAFETIVAGVLAASAVASTGVAVYGTVEAGQQQKAAADYKAKQLQRQALEAEQAKGLEIAAQDQKQTAILSSIRANAAASGVSPGAGSALLDYSSASEQAQLNDMYAKYAGNITASGDIAQANLASYGGDIAKQTSYYTAAGDVLAGVGTVGKLYLNNPDAFSSKKPQTQQTFPIT